jgi:replicative DNA helicase
MSDETPTVPHNLDAEKAVLGAVLIDNALLSAAAAVVQPRDFFRDAHGRLFGAMLALGARGDAIDLVMLRATLAPADLEHIGGPVYIASLLDGVPRSTNVAHYVRCGVVPMCVIGRERLRAMLPLAANHGSDRSDCRRGTIRAHKNILFGLRPSGCGDGRERRVDLLHT